MEGRSTFTSEQLADALYSLGIQFIMGESRGEERLHQQPARLIAALAESNELRLRLALIPLFLAHPEFAVHARTAVIQVNPAARLTLRCYYTAAVWLQRKHRSRLGLLIGRKASLPDYFSSRLGVQNTQEPGANLQLLAERHRILSGAPVNWLGTYEHAFQVWVRGLEMQKA